MKEIKITDDEIIKALECCHEDSDCGNCQYGMFRTKSGLCVDLLHKGARDLINCQKSKIDKLEMERMYYMDKYHELAKTEERMWQEATEYFAEELKQRIKNQPKWQCMMRGDRQAYGFSCDEIMQTVDEVLKEMTEGEQNESSNDKYSTETV